MGEIRSLKNIPSHTDGHINGHSWLGLNSQSRIIILSGLSHGIAEKPTRFSPAFQKTLWKNGLAGSAEIIGNQIEDFYSEPQNLLIPVTLALKMQIFAPLSLTKRQQRIFIEELQEIYESPTVPQRKERLEKLLKETLRG